MEKDCRVEKKTPLVTAIIVTHNRYNLVQKAICSVQSQTYAAIELIVVDDASDAEIRDALSAQSAREGFRYLYIAPVDSKGGDYARNQGIIRGEGKYVAFLDDDDEWLPQKTEKQVALLESREDCGVCYCGQVREEYETGKRKETDMSALSEGDLSREIFIKWQCLSSQIMVERNLLIEAGLFDENLRFWQDYELCMRLFQKTRVCVVRECLTLYRVMRSDPQRLTNRLDGWEEAVSYIKKKHTPEMEALSREDRRRRDYHWSRDGAARCVACGDRKRERNYLWRTFRASHRLNDFVKAVCNVYSFHDASRRFSHRNKIN